MQNVHFDCDFVNSHSLTDEAELLGIELGLADEAPGHLLDLGAIRPGHERAAFAYGLAWGRQLHQERVEALAALAAEEAAWAATLGGLEPELTTEQRRQALGLRLLVA